LARTTCDASSGDHGSSRPFNGAGTGKAPKPPRRKDIIGGLLITHQGRSPYDDVVEGTGEEDPRAPKQEYDQRGHPVNPETKRINKEIIRSHNEIMSIVGVAEIDNPSSAQEAQTQSRMDNETEELLARRIGLAGRWSLDAVGFLGLHGLRQRALVCAPSMQNDGPVLF
jgi:hypothetical protein